MRITVQYIPLSKIKPDLTVKMTESILKMRNMMWDCVHLIAVRKNQKDGNFTLLSGHDRYHYLRNHTNKKYAPCLVDDKENPPACPSRLQRWKTPKMLTEFPEIDIEKLMPASVSIIRAFIKQEPRFAGLSAGQKLKVLLLGIRYKRTVVLSMKEKVDEYLENK